MYLVFYFQNVPSCISTHFAITHCWAGYISVLIYPRRNRSPDVKNDLFKVHQVSFFGFLFISWL